MFIPNPAPYKRYSPRGGGVEHTNSKLFGLNDHSGRSEESPFLKSLEVEKFRSLGEFTVIQSPQGEESRSSTFHFKLIAAEEIRPLSAPDGEVPLRGEGEIKPVTNSSTFREEGVLC